MKHENIVKLLAGSYSLLNRTIYRNDAVNIDLDWIGHLTYTPTPTSPSHDLDIDSPGQGHGHGYISAITSNTNPEMRPLNLGWPPRSTDAIEDWADVGKTSFCFAGPFTVLGVDEHLGADPGEIKGLIVHGPMTVTSLPSFMGVSEFRNFTVWVGNGGDGGLFGKGKGKGKGNQGVSEDEIVLGWHLWLSDDGVDRADVYWRKIV